MLTYLFGILAAGGVLAGAICLAAAGFRNEDRPGDARVTGLPLRTGGGAGPAQPRDESASPCLLP